MDDAGNSTANRLRAGVAGRRAAVLVWDFQGASRDVLMVRADEPGLRVAPAAARGGAGGHPEGHRDPRLGLRERHGGQAPPGHGAVRCGARLGLPGCVQGFFDVTLCGFLGIFDGA